MNGDKAPSCIRHLRLPDMSLKREYAGWPRRQNRRHQDWTVGPMGWVKTYLSLPRLGEWTSIQELFWDILGTFVVPGFWMVLTHSHVQVGEWLGSWPFVVLQHIYIYMCKSTYHILILFGVSSLEPIWCVRRKTKRWKYILQSFMFIHIYIYT